MPINHQPPIKKSKSPPDPHHQIKPTLHLIKSPSTTMETRRRSARIQSQSDEESSVASSRPTTPTRTRSRTKSDASKSNGGVDASKSDDTPRRTRANSASKRGGKKLDVIHEAVEIIAAGEFRLSLAVLCVFVCLNGDSSSCVF
jgi:hypothetical protein